MSELRRVVIVGASLAGLRAANALRVAGFEGELTLIGEEVHAPYDRPPLSKQVLVGEMAADDVALPVKDGLDARWLLGERAVGLDATERVIRTASGADVPLDGLIVATGSAPRRLPGLEPDGETIFDVRTLDDSVGLRSALDAGRRLLVVGCGFIGVEVAAAARQLELAVTVVSLDPPLVPAGALASETAQALLEEHGVDLRVGRTVASLSWEGAGRRATLDDGAQVEADVVVVAVGAIPRIDWLTGSGLRLEDGIVCDASLRAAGVEGVVAAGDVARWPNPAFGGASMRVEHWSNAIEQGAAAARTLVRGDEAAPFSSVPSFWSDHFGTRLQSLGVPALADEFRVTEGAVQEHRFAAGGYRDGVLVGAVAYGMPPKAMMPFHAELARPDVSRRG